MVQGSRPAGGQGRVRSAAAPLLRAPPVAAQRVVVPVPVLGVELDAPIEPEPLVLGLVLLLGLLLELPLAPMPLVPDEPLEPELLGEVVLPLLPMLVEPPEPLPDGEVVLPLVPAVLLPDLVPAVSLPPWPHAVSDRAAAATTASAALEKKEAFIWISWLVSWEDENTGSHGCLRPL